MRCAVSGKGRTRALSATADCDNRSDHWDLLIGEVSRMRMSIHLTELGMSPLHVKLMNWLVAVSR